MFCGKCGTKNNDGVTFCAGCGASLNGRQPERAHSPAARNASNKNQKIGIIAVAVAAVVIISLIFTLFGGRGYKATVNKYMNAQFDGNAKAILKLVHKTMRDDVLEDKGYDEDEIDELAKDYKEDEKESLEYFFDLFGVKPKYSYKIEDVEDVTDDDLDDLKDEYEEEYDLKVSAAKIVEVGVTIDLGGDSEPVTRHVYLIKVGRSWYLDTENMWSIF